MMEVKEIPFKDIFNWTNVTNAEAIGENEFYHMTEIGKKVLQMVQTSPPGAMIAVIGLQGIGKTRLMYQLKKALSNRTYVMKWTSLSHTRQLIDRICGPRRHQFGSSYEPETKLEYVERPASFFKGYKVLLIDLPDYTKRTISRRDKDLDDIQWCRNIAINDVQEWNRRIDSMLQNAKLKGYTTRVAKKRRLSTLVLFIQKELYTDHFFLNKFNKFELERITPETFVDIFDFKFQKHPFAKEAIHQIAVLSRGIFRRFQNYINICMNAWLKNYEAAGHNSKITVAQVNELIPTEKVAKDMDLELARYFRAPERRDDAVEVLKFLEENKETGQDELTKEIFGDKKMRASRILRGLKKGGYIASTRKGKFNYWRLKEW